MGKAVPSYRMALEDEILSWHKSAETLDTQDQDAFEALMDASRNYCMAAGNAARPVVFEAMTMSILLHQQKQLNKLEKELSSLRE
ncbi:MAG TPA: hypothetical protein VMS94_05580 [Acidobacteriota bacterium]|nr:hypothetical protein [Acidobacteriota bacterium]